MKKTLSFVLALVMLFSLCCTGTAFADAPSPVEAFSGIGRGLSRGVHASLSGASEKAAPAEAAAPAEEEAAVESLVPAETLTQLGKGLSRGVHASLGGAGAKAADQEAPAKEAAPANEDAAAGSLAPAETLTQLGRGLSRGVHASLGGAGAKAAEAAEPAEKTEPAEEAAEPAEEKAAPETEEEEPAEQAPALVEGFAYEEVFGEWNKEAPALNTLIEYVQAVTDEASPDYIPEADRIAVFDMDGTLYGELFPTYLEYYMLAWRILKDPSLSPDAEMLALGRELRESVINHSFASDMPIRHAKQAARAYAGMSLKEFAAFVNEILIRDVDGFEGMTYGNAFYQPMLEVIDYLQDNDFTVYVVSGSDRAICRSLLEGVIDIPYANIIGMDVGYEASGQGDKDGLDYVFQAGDDVLRTDKLIIKNLKMNKVLQIVQDIGQKPVLSFGNSSGDVSMHMYTISNNPYRSAAFMLIADDETRDYGNEQKVQSLKKEWEDDGFHVISMKNDFRTIYGDNVVKTGSFRWAEEMQDDRVAVENSPDWIAALGQEKNAEQLFVVAGVGDRTAWVSLHEKDENGGWKQIMSTPGYIGRFGLGKQKEGDFKTPVGTFSFNAAFGIAEDPGCAIDYQQVNSNDYWSGDQREGYHYNEMVSIKDLPDLNKDESEHIVDYQVPYQYCLNISYNEEGTPGLGSAIFLHCLGSAKPYTAGCVAIPQEQMLTVMKHVSPECVVVIDTLENLDEDTWVDWGLVPVTQAPPAEQEAEAADEPTPEETVQAPEIDYGSSALFTDKDMDEAIDRILEEFDGWDGCVMHSIRYAGDRCCSRRNIRWLNELDPEHDIVECIEFLSDYHAPLEQIGAWEQDAEYTDWQWWLGRSEGGEWELLTWGY